jgi:DNA-binding MarR family transcriptional regulator
MIIYESLTSIRTLIYLYKNDGEYGQNIAFSLRITYSHLSNLLTELEKDGLISKTKFGRIKQVSLTKKGKEITKKLIEINDLMYKK